MTNSIKPLFTSDADCFIWIKGLGIKNDRSQLDFAWLSNLYWSDINVGNDRYPTQSRHGGYYIVILNINK